MNLLSYPATLNPMGRFASTVKFYSRCREPYPPAFFQKIVQRLALTGRELLLDVGCGPAPLAIGLAPYVGECTGIDPEPAMLAAAQTAAAQAGVSLTLLNARLEDFTADDTFDLITIGRAHHWLDRDAAILILDRILAPRGRVLICAATNEESPVSPWRTHYDNVRHAYARSGENELDRLTPEEFFDGSQFREVEIISVTETRTVTIADLIGRALSRSYTCPAMLGDRRTKFESELISTLEPFAPNGTLQEEVEARAAVFSRQAR